MPWPATGVAIDDIALLFIETANQAVSLTTPAGFVEVPSSPQGTGTAGGTASTRLTVYWARATSTTPPSPVTNAPGDHIYGRILTFRGCKNTGNPWDVMAGDVLTAASTTCTIPGATTSVPECLIVAACSYATDSGGNQAPTLTNASLVSVTERSDAGTTSGNGGGVIVDTGVLTAAGTYNATTGTLTTATVQGRISIALAPPPVGTAAGEQPVVVRQAVMRSAVR